MEGLASDCETIKAVFRQFDDTNAQTIPLEKLVKVLLILNPSFDPKALSTLLELSNVDNNGDVKYEEFVDFVSPKGIGLDNAADTVRVPPPASTEKPSSDFGADDDDVEELTRIKQTARPRRVSVSAARISDDDVKDYKKPVYPKDEAANESLQNILKSNEKLDVLCGHLSKEAVDDIINAFYTKEFSDGTDIIKQGDNGECLYIIIDGSVDIFVRRANDPNPVADKGEKICTWEAGALFGELALMYEAPRAATVTANAPVSTWVLDAVDFKMLLVKSSSAQYAKYDGWLRNVKLLESLNHFELQQLSDTMESDCFDPDEEIVVRGYEGDKFFILEDGTAAAFIDGPEGEKEVKQYLEGDFFGEIALLTQEPQRATVRATGSGCSVSYVTQEDFATALGPVMDKLREGVDKYPKYETFVGK